MMAQNKYQRYILGGFILFMVLSANLSYSQGFRGGLIAGINGSQIQGDGLSGYNKPGLVLGFTAEFPLSERWTFDPEFIYSQKGSRTSDSEFQNGVPMFIFRLNYLDIPVLVNYKITEGIIAEMGVSPNILINASIDNSVTVANARDRFNAMDFALVAGLEYYVTYNIAINGRIGYSVIPMNRQETYNNQTPSNYFSTLALGAGQYNNYLNFAIRYMFDLNGTGAKKSGGSKPSLN